MKKIGKASIQQAMKQLKKPSKSTVREYIMIVLGCLLYAVGQLYFIKGLLIPLGGVSGISLVLNYLWGLPVGVMNIIFNVPLFFLGYRTMGRQFFCRTVVGVLVSSLFIDGLTPYLSYFQGEMLISALYGGVVMGVGFGLIYRAGGTSGGTDIVAKYLNRKKGTSVGTFNFAADVVIMVGSALVYGKLESALYAMITSYVSAAIIDKLVYGADIQKSAMIITSKPKEVADIIMREMKHGVTALEGKGMYTGDARTVLVCAVRRHEAVTLKNLLLQADEDAFVLLSNVNEVFGNGFKNYES